MCIKHAVMTDSKKTSCSHAAQASQHNCADKLMSSLGVSNIALPVPTAALLHQTELCVLFFSQRS